MGMTECPGSEIPAIMCGVPTTYGREDAVVFSCPFVQRRDVFLYRCFIKESVVEELGNRFVVNARSKSTRMRRRVVIVGGLTVLLTVAIFGRGTVSWWARHVAARHLSSGGIGAAEEWLTWADRQDPDNDATDLMRASCFRHLGQQDDWQTALASARQNGARRKEMTRELLLENLQWGTAEKPSARDIDSLIQSGTAPREAATAVVYGLLANGELDAAAELISGWAADTDDATHASFLRGLWSRSAGQRPSAKEEFEYALRRQPGHEMARAGLAQLLEEAYDFEQALVHYATLFNTAPGRVTIKVELARLLRKSGRIEDARSVLSPPTTKTEMSVRMVIELAEIEYDSGNYNEARRWFERANLEGAHRADTLRAAASAYALEGNITDAEQLFARVDKAQSFSRQTTEWQRRLAIDPGDSHSASELERLTDRPQPTRSAGVTGSSTAERVSPLYLKHCAACHGDDGNGRAARHLHPQPRDLRAGRHRLVSTLNGVATLKDFERVIRLGIPGTSMPAFDDLSNDQRKQLAQQVQQFHRDGIHERLLAELRREGEEPNESDLRQMVAAVTTPGQVAEIPGIDPANAQSIEKGRAHYFKFGCRQCHGTQGTGVRNLPLLDEEGRPTLPRDLVHDPMKGGLDPESLYRRIRLGMPGTPHPASPMLSAAEYIALVHFCLSLSENPKKSLTNHQRSMQTARNASAARFSPAPTTRDHSPPSENRPHE